MRVPFPLSLRVGTDIIATGRILCPVKPDQRRLVRLTKRYLHPSELYILERRFPAWKALESSSESQRRQLSGWLAGRWAAKEAAKKAWGATHLSFTDLKVETEIGGSVQIVCDVGRGSEDGSKSLPNDSNRVTEQIAQLSISHDGDYTIATVIATPLHTDIMTELAARKPKAEAKVSDMHDLA